MNEFDQYIRNATGEELYAEDLDTIQVNIGLVCNQECVHCHVASSPRRKEEMTWEIMEHILKTADECNCRQVDITGGAPELNPNFCRFIEALRDQGQIAQVRTNLTVLLEPGMEHIPEFYKKHKVQLVASLPCYLEQNVDKQRGVGVYNRSIEALQVLNNIGYGIEPELTLNLVYNPVGPQLPPDQQQLEADYKRELNERFGIQFTSLHTITNMPIGRFRTDLKREKKEIEYMDLLKNSFNAATVDPLMCRHQINIDWNGNLYDCDFNLALRWKVHDSVPKNIKDFDPKQLMNRKIVTGDHCFGCTAGCGSSCGGALVSVA